MSVNHKWGPLLTLTLLAISFVVHAQTQTQPGLPKAANMFSWSEAEKVQGFSHTGAIFPTESFTHGPAVLPLPPASPDVMARAAQLHYQYGIDANGAAHNRNSVDDFMQHNQVTGLLILKDGAVVLERYARGVDSHTLWDSKSVGKSVVSTLMGVAVEQGFIRSLDDPVEKYIPELKHSAYQGVSLKNMLQMSSGVAWQEDELESDSDIKKLLACSIKKNSPRCMLDLMRHLKRAVDPATKKPVAPGVLWNYSSGEAYLSGLVVQRATKQTLGQYLQQTIWQNDGMEADGKWIARDGVSMGAGGFNATLRDYGRFGLFVMNNGVLADGRKLLPENWVRDATRWTAASATPGSSDNGQYGYMWWFSAGSDNGLKPDPLYVNIGAPLQNADAKSKSLHGSELIQGQAASVSDWTFSALGIYGQMIAINQAEHLVVVQWSVWDKPDPVCCDKSNIEYDARDPYTEQAVFVNAVIRALH